MSNIFLVSSVSGGGKDTMIAHVREQQPSLERFVTTTSRPIREGEEEGREYYFITKEEFMKGIEEDAFFEHDYHYGYYYGATRKELKRVKQSNEPVIWKTDPKKGLEFIKKMIPEAKIIAIIPESEEVFEKWLRERGTDTDEEITHRLQESKSELELLKQRADFIVTNRDGKIDEAVQDFLNIVNTK